MDVLRTLILDILYQIFPYKFVDLGVEIKSLTSLHFIL